MSRKKLYDFNALASELFDDLAAAPDGLTIYEICDKLGVPRHTANTVIRHLRTDLGDGDAIAVVIVHDGRKQRYVLSGDPSEQGAVYSYSHTRSKTSAAQLGTLISTWTAVARGCELNPLERMKSEFITKSLGRIQEDLEDLFPEVQIEKSAA